VGEAFASAAYDRIWFEMALMGAGVMTRDCEIVISNQYHILIMRGFFKDARFHFRRCFEGDRIDNGMLWSFAEVLTRF